MPDEHHPHPSAETDGGKLKIYFLPNLFTAGNLFCGFVALTKIVEADVENGQFYDIRLALGFILLACIFDLFDGRIARMGGVESPFGREFDSLGDLISFWAAPAFFVDRVVYGQEKGRPVRPEATKKKARHRIITETPMK